MRKYKKMTLKEFKQALQAAEICTDYEALLNEICAHRKQCENVLYQNGCGSAARRNGAQASTLFQILESRGYYEQ